MRFELLGKEGAPSLMLIPGLGVSYEIFLPLVELLKDKFRITAVQVDGFTLGEQDHGDGEQKLFHIRSI